MFSILSLERDLFSVSTLVCIIEQCLLLRDNVMF